MMYDGNEKVILKGEYLNYSMLDFWRWAYSNIHYNMQRGTFADYQIWPAPSIDGKYSKATSCKSDTSVSGGA